MAQVWGWITVEPFVPQCDRIAVIKAGDLAVQHGADFLIAHDAMLTGLGYGYTGAPCQCEDPDAGHDPSCGWSLVAGAPAHGEGGCRERHLAIA